MEGHTDVLYIVIPAYNESENIECCVNEWYPIVERHNDGNMSRLVVVNDGSSDNTYELLLKMQSDKPLLCALTKENGGHGSAVLFGYNYAIEKGADYIFQTDSDGQTNPGEFEAFWNKRQDYDAVIGERTIRGDGKKRKLVEDIVCLILLFVFGIKVKDANAPYRLMNRSIIKKYAELLPKDYNLPNIMFTAIFLYFKERVIFLPISFSPRRAGTNTIDLRKIFRIGIGAIVDFVHIKHDCDLVKTN